MLSEEISLIRAWKHRAGDTWCKVVVDQSTESDGRPYETRVVSLCPIMGMDKRDSILPGFETIAVAIPLTGTEDAGNTSLRKELGASGILGLGRLLLGPGTLLRVSVLPAGTATNC